MCLCSHKSASPLIGKEIREEGEEVFVRRSDKPGPRQRAAQLKSVRSDFGSYNFISMINFYPFGQSLQQSQPRVATFRGLNVRGYWVLGGLYVGIKI